MADIDVSFSTNAGAVASQVDQAAVATARASQAAQAHAVAAKAQATAMGQTIAAAKLHGTATKEEIHAMRISQLEMRKKATEAQQLALVQKAAAQAAQTQATQAHRAAAAEAQQLALVQKAAAQAAQTQATQAHRAAAAEAQQLALVQKAQAQAHAAAATQASRASAQATQVQAAQAALAQKAAGQAAQAAQVQTVAAQKLAAAQAAAAAASAKQAQAQIVVGQRLAATQATQAQASAKQQHLAQRQRTMQGAGFLGGGRFAAGASALVGKDAGLGSLVGAMGMMAGVGIAISLLTGAISAWMGKVDEQRAVTEKATDEWSATRKANIERGIGAAGSFGGALTRSIAMGTRGSAGGLMTDFRAGDSLSAASKAAELFPGQEGQALSIAATVAKTLGEPLANVVDKMQGARLNADTGRAVASELLGRVTTGGQWAEMQSRVAGSREAQNIGILNRESAATDADGISQIGKAALGSAQRLLEMRTAEAVQAAEVLANFARIAAIQKEQADQIERWMSYANYLLPGLGNIRGSL